MTPAPVASQDEAATTREKIDAEWKELKARSITRSLTAVLKLHRPEHHMAGTVCAECNVDTYGDLREDCKHEWWPCPTVQAVADALGVELTVSEE